MIVQNVSLSSVYSSPASQVARTCSGKSSSSEVSGGVRAGTNDTVSLSPAAKALAVAGTSASSPAAADNPYAWLSEAAHSDPSMAHMIAESFAYADEGTCMSVELSHELIRAGTIADYMKNQRVSSNFDERSTDIRNARIDLYLSEKAKGSSDADIVDKILAYQNALPEDYKQLTGWKS